MDAIFIEELTKVYKGQTGRRKEALSGLNLTVETGEIFGFVGPNGAGKSTTIKLLLDIIRPTAGKALIFGEPVSKPECRKRVGFLPERPCYYDFLTPLEMLTFAGKVFGMKREPLNERIENLLKQVDLFDVRRLPLRKFSKGMVQRAGIARALVSDPDLVIFDEPASGLDPVGRKMVVDILLDLKARGKTVFFSSHILHDVEVLCDRVGIIVNGRLVKVESISTLLSKSTSGVEVFVQGVDSRLLAELASKGFKARNEGDMVRIAVSGDERLWSLLGMLKEKNCGLYSVEPKRKSMEETLFEYIDRKG